MKLPRFLRRESGSINLRDLIFSGNFGGNVVNVNDPYLAMKIAAVNRAVNLISNGVGVLPMYYKRKDYVDRYFKIADTNEADSMMNYLLNVQPNARMTAFQFWKTLVTQVLLQGNAYVYPDRSDTGQIRHLFLLSPGTVSYNLFNNTYNVSDSWNGIVGMFDATQIIHIKNACLDGYYGISTIAYGAQVLKIAGTSDAETLRRFATGGRFKAIVSNDTSVKGFGQYQDKELKKSSEDIDQALREGKDIISMPGDNKITPISMSSTDMQFLDSRKFTIAEIARLFGVPRAKLMDDSNTVYGTAEAANIAFYSEALQPILTAIEQEFKAKLIGPDRASYYKFAFDLTGLFALDRKGMAEWNVSRLGSGQVSINDLRRESDLPPVEGGDRLYLSVQLQPMDNPTTQPSE